MNFVPLPDDIWQHHIFPILPVESYRCLRLVCVQFERLTAAITNVVTINTPMRLRSFGSIAAKSRLNIGCTVLIDTLAVLAVDYLGKHLVSLAIDEVRLDYDPIAPFILLFPRLCGL